MKQVEVEEHYDKDGKLIKILANGIEVYMEKPELTKEESDIYIKIVSQGTMDDMFDFAYAIGRERLATEQLENLTTTC